MPPMPVAMAVPMRSGAGWFGMSSSASATASRAAAMASCTKRSVRRTSLRSSATVGSKSLTSQAKVTGASEASKSVIGAAPLRPGQEPFPARLAVECRAA